MNEMLMARIVINILSAPFGFTAMYYGYKGYSTTKGGLKAYQYFFFAMTALGAAVLSDLICLMGMEWPDSILGGWAPYCHDLMLISLIFVAFFMLLSFRNIYKFVSKAFTVK